MKQQTLYKYTFNNGDVITSTLQRDELIKRMNRLDTLRVLVEAFVDEGNDIADNIYSKAIRAYNKTDHFTGQIRLTFSEKDWLAYLLENDMLDDEDRECIRYFTRM